MYKLNEVQFEALQTAMRLRVGSTSHFITRCIVVDGLSVSEAAKRAAVPYRTAYAAHARFNEFMGNIELLTSTGGQDQAASVKLAQLYCKELRNSMPPSTFKNIVDNGYNFANQCDINQVMVNAIELYNLATVETIDLFVKDSKGDYSINNIVKKAFSIAEAYNYQL